MTKQASRRSRSLLSLAGLASGLMLAVSGLQGIAPVAAQTVSPVDDHGTDFGRPHDPRLDDLFARGLDDHQVDVLGGFLNLPSTSVRLMGEDDLLGMAHSLGSDDQSLVNMLLADQPQEDRQFEVGDDRLTGEPGDVRQEDRQQDRQLEVGDDRLTGQPGDVRQEDRQVEAGDDRLTGEPGDVRQEDRQQDRQLEVGDDRLTGQPADDRGRGSDDASRAAAPATTDDSHRDQGGSNGSGPSQPASTSSDRSNPGPSSSSGTNSGSSATSNSHGGSSAPAASPSSSSSSSSSTTSAAPKPSSTSSSGSTASGRSSGGSSGGSHDGGGHH